METGKKKRKKYASFFHEGRWNNNYAKPREALQPRNPAIVSGRFSHGYDRQKLRGIPVPSVRTDNRAAAAALVRGLAEKGCRRIAFFTTEDTEAISVRERRNGFINEMERLNLTEAGICVLPSGRGAEGFLDNRPDPNAIRAVRKFLEKERREIDAVIAEEYGIVPVVTAAAAQVGIDLEQDIRLACIDEDYLAPYGPVFLHVKQNEAAIAKKAVELLLGRIAGNRYEDDDYLIAGILRNV